MKRLPRFCPPSSIFICYFNLPDAVLALALALFLSLVRTLFARSLVHTGTRFLDTSRRRANRPHVLLVIDNYDSFTYNLVQYFGQLGVEQKVYRNDQITVEEALALNPDRVMISPGPCSPAEAGVSCDMIRAFAGKKPVLGVCLGHQAIGHVYGGNVIRAPHLMHGKTSPVFHNNTDVFKGLPSPFAATRYHSLVVERSTFPAALEWEVPATNLFMQVSFKVCLQVPEQQGIKFGLI